jgi:hypothetical protein
MHGCLLLAARSKQLWRLRSVRTVRYRISDYRISRYRISRPQSNQRLRRRFKEQAKAV